MYTKMIVTTGVMLALVAGCKQNPRTEVSQGPAALAEPAPTQSVLVDEPVQSVEPQAMARQDDGSYSQPYPARQWGPAPAPDPAPVEMRLSEPQPTPMVAPEPVAQPAVHVVQKGDTLWSIADAYYGSGTRWQDIAAANPGVNPNKLPIGQELVLPQ